MGMRARCIVGDSEDMDVAKGCLLGLLAVATGLGVMYIGMSLLWRFVGWLVTLPK